MQLSEPNSASIATVKETTSSSVTTASKETINPDTGTVYEKGKLYNISIIDFQADPNQPRKVFDPDTLEELAESIKKHGILEPVLFQPGQQGYVTVVAGERRIEAAKKAGVNIIPAICVEGNASEIALVENLLRQDLTAVEEAEAIQRLMDEQKYTQEQLSGVIGKGRSTIADILTVNRLPQAIRDECRGDRKISRATLIDIARKKQERGMVTAYNAYKEKLQKAGQPRKKGEATDVNAYQPVSEWVGKVVTRLSALDTANWTEEEKKSILDVLTSLRNVIDAYINPPTTQKTTKTKTKSA